MLIKRTAIACILTLVLLTLLTACGGNSTNSTSQQAADQQSAGQAAAPAQTLPKADPKATVDSLLGNWTDINSPDRFANITKTDNGYQYQDNEGTYPATFKDGVLKVQVSDTDTADTYIDTKSGHLFAVYQGSPSEFKKK